MGPVQKRITIALWITALPAVVGILVGRTFLQRLNSEQAADSARASQHTPPPMRDIFLAPSISLTDQDGKRFSTESLAGKVWVADFIFTSCGSICPILSDRMAHLEKMTPAGVNFVSFSVDPKNDTPAVLKAYGARLGADFSRWHFLTGSVDQMTDAAIKMKVATGSANLLTHSDRFLLVNAKGMVVGIYSGLDSIELNQLSDDAITLAGDSAATSQPATTGSAG